jgi:hypothetical protein
MQLQAQRGRIAFGCLCVALSILTCPGSTYYVRTDGRTGADGTTWTNALPAIGSALALAKSGDEIRVASGVYPEHLVLKSGVALYGGFHGEEGALAERDWLRNETILDGTTNGTVVTIRNGTAETLLDGFTIRNGSGVGVYCSSTAGTVRHNLIRGNVGTASAAYGGGIGVNGSSTNGPLLIESNRIIDNINFDGGGIACIDASPHIAGNVIAWNMAQQNGGGISCWRNSSPLIANNVIVGNTASWLQSSVVPIGGGAIFATADDLDGRPHPTAVSGPVIMNNLIAANGARKGGGIALVDSNGGVPSLINNTIFANNGSGIYWGSSSLPLVGLVPIIRNNIVAFNPWGLEQAEGTPPDPTIENNCVYGNQLQGQTGNYVGLNERTGTNGNISLDPLLASARFGNAHLQPNSPCVDAGKPSNDPLALTDIDAQNRVQGKAVDIGADESDGTTWHIAESVIRVSPLGNDAADGLTWVTAKKTVQAGIDAVKLSGGEVWVAGGTYLEHIDLPAFVYLYGGFAGVESNRAARQGAGNPSILDGAGQIKVVLCGNAGYLVSALDGFTIQNGGNYTAGGGLSPYGPGGLGGGIYIGVSSPYIANNLITRNSLAYDNSLTFPQPPSYGAGIYCDLSYAVITGNTIRDNEILNTFDGSGGGVYCIRSMPTIEGNTFSQNHAVYGAAIYAEQTSPAIHGNVIQNNAMYNTYPLPLYLGSMSGAVTIETGARFWIEGNTISSNTAALGAGVTLSSPIAGRLENNLFIANHAYDPTAGGGMGGGVYCLISTNAVETVTIAHNTLVGNVASNLFGEQGGGLAISLVPPTDKLLIANNLIVSNSSGIYQTLTTPMSRAALLNNDLFNQHSNYLNLPAGAADLSCDPRFVNAANGDYHLRPGSACIDAGTPLAASQADKDHTPRALDGNNDGTAAPDIGAFELVHPSADSDRDGMPDAWELSHGLNPIVPDGTSDADADGASNAAEYVAGTDPLDPSSVLRVQAYVEPPKTIVLRWPTVPGRSYVLQSTDRMMGGLWRNVGEGSVGAGGIQEFREPLGTVTNQFYRLTVRN